MKANAGPDAVGAGQTFHEKEEKDDNREGDEVANQALDPGVESVLAREGVEEELDGGKDNGDDNLDIGGEEGKKDAEDLGENGDSNDDKEDS